MKKEKLCLVISSLHAGGMERVMSQLSFFFCRKKELEVHLILYGRDPEIFYKIPEELIVHQSKARFNDKFRTISTVKRLCFLRGEIRNINPLCILSFGEYWNSFVLLSLYGLNYPVYVSDRCQPGKYLGKLHTILRKWLYPQAEGIIAQTFKAREIYMNEFGHKNIRIIGNPVSLINELPDKNVKENIILTIGRLIKTKNHDKLIELFVKINKPGWKLVIVGDDAQKQDLKIRLQTLIGQLNAENKVILAGNQSDVGKFYLKSKIFAFASDSEGFPNVIGEAQSYGLPLIAFDCIAGPSDLIKNDVNGLLIPLYDYDLFQKKLQLLMDNSELRDRYGLNARESIKKFSIEHIGKQFYNFIYCNK